MGFFFLGGEWEKERLLEAELKHFPAVSSRGICPWMRVSVLSVSGSNNVKMANC